MSAWASAFLQYEPRFLVWHAPPLTAEMKVAVADYDGGLVGQALIQTVRQRQSKLLPMTYEVIDTTSVPYSELSRQVNWGWYHSAMVVPAGSSKSLQGGLTVSSGLLTLHARVPFLKPRPPVGIGRLECNGGVGVRPGPGRPAGQRIDTEHVSLLLQPASQTGV